MYTMPLMTTDFSRKPCIKLVWKEKTEFLELNSSQGLQLSEIVQGHESKSSK
jgi:hypothetical protein